MAAVKAAVEAILNNVALRAILLALVGALVSVTLLLGQRELGNVERAITKQSEVIKEQSGALAGLERKIGDVSEKLAASRSDTPVTRIASARSRRRSPS